MNNFCANAQSRQDAQQSGKKWFPCQKGGSFRKWYGNYEFVVDWFNDGEKLKAVAAQRYGSYTKRIVNEDYYFLEGITWSTISSSVFSMRYNPTGFIFETKGSVCFSKTQDALFNALGFLNTKLVEMFLKATSPTLDFHEGPVGRLPLYQHILSGVNDLVNRAIRCNSLDWDAYETSWDFTNLPLLCTEHSRSTLAATYAALFVHWQQMINEMQQLEEENNRIFIEAYDLQDELTPDVPLSEITLTCNPYYRYDAKKPAAELEQLLLADTMREFISYSVGCMFGRYALEKPGLILANQGESIADYLKEIPAPLFPADEDNVIPMVDLEGDWFADDIVARFRNFLRVTFGAEHYAENLKFIEDAIGKSIYRYFVKDFYTDHVRRYKKRPIYWLFSSPKGSFNALIYMHRYRPDTVSVVLNDYLREFRSKLTSEQQRREHESIRATATSAAKTKALKEVEKLRQIIVELDEYERDILYPLATQQITIDLDDGVKVNYPKFGAALKKIPGLDVSDE